MTNNTDSPAGIADGEINKVRERWKAAVPSATSPGKSMLVWWSQYVNDVAILLRKVAELESERDRLRSALEPFAKQADNWSAEAADSEELVTTTRATFRNAEGSYDWSVDCTIGDLRRAAAALADAGKGGGE